MKQTETIHRHSSSAGLEKSSNQPGSPRRLRLAGTIVGILAVLVVAGVAIFLATTLKNNPATEEANASNPEVGFTPGPWNRPAVSDAGLLDRSGIKITEVSLTGSGGLVDLRFQVVDPVKADAVHDPGNPPAIVDDATGVVVNSLLMGHSHSDPFKAGSTYYLIFENPGNLVQVGSTVSVLLGNAQVEHVVVH